MQIDKANEKTLQRNVTYNFGNIRPEKRIRKGILPFRGPQKNRDKETKIVQPKTNLGLITHKRTLRFSGSTKRHE